MATFLALRQLLCMQGLNGLHLAAKNGHSDCLEHLLDSCSLDINANATLDGISPLHCCMLAKSEGKKYHCLKLLLDKGADYKM